MRAVFDPNILIAALLSRHGAPAQIVSGWLAGEFELIVSDALLAELERALSYPKLRHRLGADESQEFLALLRASALVAHDVPTPQPRSIDLGDDYLLALAEREHAILVSGDRDLLDLASRFPIQTASQFRDTLDRGSLTPNL